MSFNYREVSFAVQEISHILSEVGTQVQKVELVDFRIPEGLEDINLGLHLGHSFLVFSLKSPWTGVFYSRLSDWKPATVKWNKAFKNIENIESYLVGSEIVRLSAVEGDRVVEVEFKRSTQQRYHLRVELFPTKPNWILTCSDNSSDTSKQKQVFWKNSTASHKSDFQKNEFFIREFQNQKSPLWLQRSYFHYLHAREKFLFEKNQQRGLALLEAQLTQVIKVRGKLQESLRESSNVEEIKNRAEALKGVMYQYPKNQFLKAVPVYINDEEISLQLNQSLSLSENLTAMFEKYKKHQRTQVEAKERLKLVESTTKKITTHLTLLRNLKFDESGEFKNQYEALKTLLQELRLEKDKKEKQKVKNSKIKSFLTKEGLSIWVGRKSSENEEIVMKIAKGNDMWVHVKGRPGAHAVIRIPKGKSASLESILDAAHLVAHYSGVSEKVSTEIDYTFRKYVKRVPGVKAGSFLVTYSQNKTLMIQVDTSRLKRLLQE